MGGDKAGLSGGRPYAGAGQSGSEGLSAGYGHASAWLGRRRCFLVEDVQAEFQRLGDVEKTRQVFREMREAAEAVRKTQQR